MFMIKICEYEMRKKKENEMCDIHISHAFLLKNFYSNTKQDNSKNIYGKQ